MAARKNDTLELIKLFAAYMVVFIHISFRGNAGLVIDALARFAVPFFFLTSGYYSYQITCEKIKTRIKHIFSLLVFSSVIYTVFEVVKLLKYNPNGLTDLLNKYTDLGTYIKLFVFNLPVISGHLWYLFAILYVYVIFYFVTKFRVKEKVVFAASFSLLALHVLLGECLSAFGIVLPLTFLRNFALMGIPFFALGLFAKKHEHKICAIPNFAVFLFLAIGVLESIISRFLFAENELYIGSLFILTALVTVTLKCKDAKYPAFLTTLNGCSAYIYIFHSMISTILLIIYGMIGVDIYSSVPLENLHPIMVCVVSTVFSFILIKILNKLKKIADK